jgi:hypothetical protein
MKMEKVQLEGAKEFNDVGELVTTLVSDIVKKKSISEISADVLPKLIAAIDGCTNLPVEMKEDPIICGATIGYHTGKIPGIIAGK